MPALRKETVVEDFSPSATLNWLRCPVYHRYTSVDRWAPRLLGKKDFAALVGEGVHTGLAWLYGTVWSEDGQDAAAAGSRVMAARWRAWVAEGRTWPTAPKDLTHSLSEWQQEAGHMIRAYAKKNDPIGETFATELTLGRGRIDWLGKIAGEWAVVDFKTKRTVADRYRIPMIEDVHYAWPLYDYLWRASEYVKEPVRLAITEFVIGDPFEVVRESLRVTEDQMIRWQAQATLILNRMSDVPHENWTRCWNFGFGAPCDFLTACWQDGGTPNPLEYVKETSRA